MGKKEQKAKEYADNLHKTVGKYKGRMCNPEDMYYKSEYIRSAFEEGWDACMIHLAEIPWDKAMTEIVDYAKANRKEKKGE